MFCCKNVIVVMHVLMQTVEEQLKRLVLVVDAVCVDVQQGQNVYNKLFHK